MCIYYGDKPGLTYDKREHIFPAGLGGKMMLPKGFVSDQANELFSPLELKLMRKSTISFMRAMEGPGKRGSLEPPKATSSEACIYETEDGTIELGYIKAGKPYSIPHIRIDFEGDGFHFIMPGEGKDPTEILELFKKDLSRFSSKFISIHAPELGNTSILLGVWKDKFYVAYGDSVPDAEFLSNQIALFCERAKIKEIHSRDTHGKFQQHLIEDPDTCRVYAKIAYNVLANFRNEEFVSNSRFDRIRNWILGEIDIDDFVSLPQGLPIIEHLKFPDSAHFCFFQRSGNNKLIAVVCLYGAILRTFEFADWIPSLDEYPFPGVLGLICDWKQGQEYTMNDWISRLAKSMS